MDNQYIRGLRIQKKSVVKKLYAAVCMVLVAALLVSATSYAWLVLSQAPEVTGVSTTLGANGNLEIALNTNSLDTYVFTANEDTSIGIESVFDKNSYWGNVVDLSDERYGLQNIQLKPAALNYKSDAQLAVNMGAPFLIAQYGLDGRVTGLSSSGILTNFDSETNKFISSTNYGVRALGEASKALSTLTVDMDQDDAVLAVYNTYKAIADANSPEVSYQDWPAWREAVWNILLRIYFKHSDAIANGTTASESYTASTVDELETQYLVMQENIDKAYTYLQAMVICRVFADGSSLVAQAKIADLIANNEEDVREYFAAAGITDYNEALDLLDETKTACDGVLSAITSFKTTSAYTSGSISYDQIRNLLLSDLDLNNITFNENSIGAYDIASYAASRYAYCLLNKTDTLDSLYGNSSYNFSTGSGLNFMSALESIHTVAMYEYAGKLYYDGYTLTIPSYANNTELRGMTYETFMNPHNGHVRHLSWAYPYLTDSTNKGTSTNTEFYKQAYADAQTALLEAFYIPEDPEYSAFITPAFDHIISVANAETDTYAYEYLARLEAGLDALSSDFLNQYGEGIKYYALMFAALISDSEYAEGTVITEPASDSLYAKVLQAINDGKSADEVLAISGYLNYEYNVGNPPNNYYFKKLIGDPYAYMQTAIANAYARIDALKASKSTSEALSWEEIYSVIVYIIGEGFAPYNGDQIEYANDRANCSIVLDVPSKAIGNIHTLFNNQNYANDFTLSEINISAASYDSFMERLITENVGILPEHMTYGVCIYRWDIPEYGEGNFELNANGTTYAFGIDLLFRTNATAANLLLQTIGIDRIYNNDNAPEDWVYSDEWEDAQGQGSRITMDNPELLAALRVAFVDTSTGEIYGIAKADPNGYLYLSNDDGSATIKPLDQNVISAVTVWIYLDGNIVENLHADTSAATDMKINLQFATDATLNPAFGGNSETPNGGTQTPSNPSNPDVPDPTLPTNQSDYYIEHDGNNAYSFYTLNSDGSREYELTFNGSMDTANKSIVVEDITTYPANGVAIPAMATYATDNEEYAVSIDPTAPFADLGTESATIFFVPVDGEKVGLVSTDISDLFKRSSGTDYVSLDLAGLDTSTATDMSYLFCEFSNLTKLGLSGIDTSNVTSMKCMFDNCSGLTELDVSGFDTSKVTDMTLMFRFCSGLTELDISNFNTSNVSSMHQMFSACKNLTELDVTNFDTSNVTTMYAMFSVCTGLRNLDVSGFDTSNVTTMNTMFSHCSSLPSLDVSGFNTSKVTDMSHMFLSCGSLTDLDVTNFNTTNVSRMSLMFSGCSGLSELDVSNFKTSNVVDMEAMFQNCSGITTLDLSNFNTQNVTSMGYMFRGCEKLTEVNLSSFNTAKVTNMAYMFYKCAKLSSLDMSSWNISAVTNTDEFFTNCLKLQSIVVPSSVGSISISLPGEYLCESDGNKYTVIDNSVPAQAKLTKVINSPADDPSLTAVASGVAGENATWTFYDNGLFVVDGTGAMTDFASSLVDTPWDAYMDDMTDIIISDGITRVGDYSFRYSKAKTVTLGKDVKIIGDNAFDMCFNLDNVVIPEGTVELCDYAFNNCTSLSYVEIPSTVTSIGYNAFHYCPKLTSIELPDGLTHLGEFALAGNDGLVFVTIPEGITTISQGLFEGCSNLTTVLNIDQVTTIGNFAFRDCDSLETFYINEGVIRIGNYALEDCDSLTAITVAADNATYSSLNGALYDKNQTALIAVPAGYTGKFVVPSSVTELATYAFGNCDKITEIVLPEGLTEINRYAFYACRGVTTINIPTSVTTIGDYAFSSCNNLTNIAIPEAVTSIGDHAFSYCKAITSIVIPDGVTTLVNGVFAGCTNLESITIPASVKTIEDYALYSCSNLKHIYFKGSESQWNSINITASYEFPDSMAIHYNAE